MRVVGPPTQPALFRAFQGSPTPAIQLRPVAPNFVRWEAPLPAETIASLALRFWHRFPSMKRAEFAVPSFPRHWPSAKAMLLPDAPPCDRPDFQGALHRSPETAGRRW